MKQLVVVEKNSFSIKIFPDFKFNSYKYQDHMLSSVSNPMRIKGCQSSNHSYIDGIYSIFIDMVVQFENNDLKQLLFKYEDLDNRVRGQSNKPGQEVLKESETEIKLNDKLSLVCKYNIRDPGLKAGFSALKSKDDFHLLLNSSELIRYRMDKSSDVYLSDDEGSFGIIKFSGSKVDVFLFAQLTRQKAIKVKRCLNSKNENDLFLGAIVCQNSVYILHTLQNGDNGNQSPISLNSSFCSETSNDKHVTYRSFEESGNTLCKHEIEEKVDYVEVLDERTYIVCRRGVFEMYKIKCLNHTHRVKLILSVNSLSTKIMDLILLDNFLYIGCLDGAFNIYDCVYGKKNQKLVRAFDRTFGEIYKIYPSRSQSISISRKKFDSRSISLIRLLNLCIFSRELALWNLHSGQIEMKFKTKKAGLFGNIRKIKYNMNQNLFLLLTNKFELAVFQNFELLVTIDLINDEEIERRNYENSLVILNGYEFQIVNNNEDSGDQDRFSDKHLVVFNRVNYNYFKVKVPSFDFTNAEYAQVERFKPILDNVSSGFNLLSEEKLVIFCQELNYLIIVNREIKHFAVISYEGKLAMCLNENKGAIRYLNKKCNIRGNN